MVYLWQRIYGKITGLGTPGNLLATLQLRCLDIRNYSVNVFEQTEGFMPVATRHEFDLLSIPARPRLELRRATLEDLVSTTPLLKAHLASTAPHDVITRVIFCNRDSVFVFCREKRIIGFSAMLMLTPQGLEALLLAEFDPLNPIAPWLAVTGEQPAAIYSWAIIAPGVASEGIKHVSEFLRLRPFFTCNFYARPVTDLGTRLAVALGFKPVGGATPGLFLYVRITNRHTR